MWLKLSLILLFDVISYVYTQDAEAYLSCCHYCRSSPDDWMITQPSFNITAETDFITDFSFPASYQVNDIVEHRPVIHGREYVLTYAGAPIRMEYRGHTSTSSVLNHQYLEIDLIREKAVAGVTIQGGFYEDSLNVLFKREESWVSEFAVSYSTGEGRPFQYLLYNGQPKIFKGPSNYEEHKVVSFMETHDAEFIRIHPLQAKNDNGDATNVMIRANVIICTDDVCSTPKVNCEVDDWTSWSECMEGYRGYFHQRERNIYRYNACGGAICPHLREEESCDPGYPLWKLGLIIGGVLLMVMVIIIIVVIVILKMKKKKEEEIMFVKEEAPKPKKKKKRNKRFRKNSEGEMTEVAATETVKNDGEEVDDDIENEAALMSEGKKKKKKKKTDEMTDEQMAAQYLEEEKAADEDDASKRKKKKKKKKKGRRGSTISIGSEAGMDIPSEMYDDGNVKNMPPAPVVVNDDSEVLPGSEKAKEAGLIDTGPRQEANLNDELDQFEKDIAEVGTV